MIQIAKRNKRSLGYSPMNPINWTQPPI
jgi:hypothetical protein